jgi:small conductance mechanosensitive channel
VVAGTVNRILISSDPPGATAPERPPLMLLVVAFAMFMGMATPISTAKAQVPTVAAGGNSDLASGKAITAPTSDNPEATAAEASGPIEIVETVSDASVQAKLEKLLPKYPGVRYIQVEVEDGVVTLTGQVADTEVRDRLRDFVRRVQGVHLVLNQTKTDVQVFTAREFALKQVSEYWDIVSRKWVLCVFSLGLVMAAALLARLFNRFSETLLTPFTGNVLLRSVLGSVISGLIVTSGFLAALHLLGMTEAVLSFMGLAGVVALAVGFAFRDIAENFIASLMLGFRRPFHVGDFLEVAGKSGVVKSLNTRATVLVGFDGSHIRIPNSTIFKEIVVNRSASTSMRATFDVLIPWDSSIATATSAIASALREHEGLEQSPPPRTLVEAIEPGGIRLRSYFWFSSRGVDRIKLLNDAQLAAKVAMQKAGIRPASNAVVIQLSPEALREAAQSSQQKRTKQPSNEATDQTNLMNDSHASNIASSQLPQDQQNEVGHALKISETTRDEEGKNLIGDAPSRHEKESAPANQKVE